MPIDSTRKPVRTPRRFLIWAALLCLMLPASRGDADEPSLAARWSQLLTRLVDARQRAYSGEVTFKGRRVSKFKEIEPFEGRHEGTRIYDLRSQSFRYDQICDCRINVLKAGDRSLPDPNQVVPLYPVRYQACQNPEYFSRWSQRSSHSSSGIGVFPLDYDYKKKTGPCQEYPYEPLVAGIVHYWDWRQGCNLLEAHERWRSMEVEAWDEAGDLVTVTLTLPKSATYKIKIDTARMVPLGIRSKTVDGIFSYQSKADWEQRKGVWIPTSFVWRRDVVSDSFNGYESGEYTFTWKKLNEDFPQELFQYTSFSDLPFGGNDVYDYRIHGVGKAGVYLGHLQPDGSLVDQDKPRPRQVGPLTNRFMAKRPWFWIMLGNVTAALILGLFVYIRKRSRAGSAS